MHTDELWLFIYLNLCQSQGQSYVTSEWRLDANNKQVNYRKLQNLYDQFLNKGVALQMVNGQGVGAFYA